MKYDVPDPVIASLSEIEAEPKTFVEDKKPLNARWMCKGPFVPGDFALVQEGYDSKCPGTIRGNDTTNAWFIRKPGPSETICKGFLMWEGAEVEIKPIPSGYVVVGETKSAGCSISMDRKHSANAWRIKLPAAGETICKGFLIPRGFVVIGEKKASTCPATSTAANAWLIKPH